VPESEGLGAISEAKTCNRCGETKPMAEFHRNSRIPDGRLNQCKACVRTRMSAAKQATPSRYCQCGCRAELPPSDRPRRFLHGHSGGPKADPVEQRFWGHVHKTDLCWIWTAHRNPLGYGQFRPKGKQTVRAHRFAYELLLGPIPEGMTLDHLCRNTRCVNPDHLEPVTAIENYRRGLACRRKPQQQREVAA
jgi:hypothetical protein